MPQKTFHFMEKPLEYITAESPLKRWTMNNEQDVFF